MLIRDIKMSQTKLSKKGKRKRVLVCCIFISKIIRIVLIGISTISLPLQFLFRNAAHSLLLRYKNLQEHGRG